jgi:hypothetical protein
MISVIYAFVLLLPSWALECPKVICGSSTRTACIDWVNNMTEVVVQPCSARGHLCENIDLKAPRQQYCQEFNGYTYDFWNPFYGTVSNFDDYEWRKTGDVCSESSVCSTDLYCTDKGVCETRKSKGDSCQQGQCKPGLVCLDYSCVKVRSVAIGEHATSKWACEEFWMDLNNICIKAPKSRGKLPVKCTSDQDCLSTDGTGGKCECGLTVHGSAFCELHYGDKPYQEYLDALVSLEVDELRWRYFEVSHYPHLQNTPDCLSDVLPASYLHQVYRDADESYLVVMAWLLLAV